MPRVPPLLEAEWKDDHRDLLARLLPDDPVDPLVATLLHAPEIVEAVLPMTRYVTDESTLSPRHRLLLGLRTAWLERSDVLWGGYAARATSDLPEMTALTVGQGESEDVAGQSLLRMADELVLNVSVTDSTWTNLASDHDVAWLMDAVESVAHVSFLCCLARSLGVQPASPALARPEADRPAVPPRQPALTAARIEPTPGDGIAVLRTFARHPALARARRPRSAFISGKSPLTPHDRETLILRIGWDCQAEYEWAKHVGSVGHARDHGIDPELVAAGPTAPRVSNHDALLMRVADDLHQDSRVSDAIWIALLEQYGLAGAMSAIYTASAYRSTSMSLNAYGVQLEAGDERLPARTE
jgi:4-carboxymuconolactone decarboxylase